MCETFRKITCTELSETDEIFWNRLNDFQSLHPTTSTLHPSSDTRSQGTLSGYLLFSWVKLVPVKAPGSHPRRCESPQTGTWKKSLILSCPCIYIFNSQNGEKHERIQNKGALIPLGWTGKCACLVANKAQVPLLGLSAPWGLPNDSLS